VSDLKKVFRPLGLGVGLVLLESEASDIHEAEAICSRPRPLKIGLEASLHGVIFRLLMPSTYCVRS